MMICQVILLSEVALLGIRWHYALCIAVRPDVQHVYRVVLQYSLAYSFLVLVLETLHVTKVL